MRRRLDRRLQRGQRAADSRQGAVGNLRPLGLVPREHVRRAIGRRRGRGQALVRVKADELSRPCADLQARPEELSRPAAAAGRIRRRASLRAVGRDAWPDAGARLYPGRRACVLHGSAARRRMPEDQRSDPVDLRGFRLRGRTHGQALDPAGKARRHRRDVGSCRARDGDGAVGDRGAGATISASRPRSIPAKARSTARNSNMCCATPSAATGNAAPRRSTSICRSDSAHSTSTPTVRRRRRSWCIARSAARWSASSAS